MTKNTINTIVSKRLKWRRTEVILLWLMIAMAIISIPAGIAIYLYVDTLAITQYISAITTGNIAVSQVRMLCDFARGLGIVFTLVGVIAIALARNRLCLGKDACRMATIIQSRTEEGQV